MAQIRLAIVGCGGMGVTLPKVQSLFLNNQCLGISD